MLHVVVDRFDVRQAGPQNLPSKHVHDDENADEADVVVASR